MTVSEVASFETNFFKIAGTSETEIVVTRIKHPIRRSLRMFVCLFFFSFIFQETDSGGHFGPQIVKF